MPIGDHEWKSGDGTIQKRHPNFETQHDIERADHQAVMNAARERREGPVVQQGMMGSSNESQRVQAARDEAEADFKRLFEAADPTITKTPRDTMVDKRQEMMESLLGRDGKNAAAREGRRGWRPPSEEVSDQRIAQSLRNKLTGQVDELSNADGRLAGFNAANDRARQQREAEDKAHLLGVRQMFALQDERKAAGDVRHRHRVTGNVTPKRVMDRRADVRGKREAQQDGSAVFRENKKIEQEKAAEAARKQRMYDEDMRQGGKLGIIRDGFAQGAAERNNKALDARAALDREDANKRLDREIESRLEAARITVGGRGAPNKERETAKKNAQDIIGRPELFDPEVVEQARQDYVSLVGQDSVDAGFPAPAPAPAPAQNVEEELKQTAFNEASEDAMAARDSIGAANHLIAAVNSGVMNYEQAFAEANNYGPEAAAAFKRYAVEGTIQPGIMGHPELPSWTKNPLGFGDASRRMQHMFRQLFLE